MLCAEEGRAGIQTDVPDMGVLFPPQKNIVLYQYNPSRSVRELFLGLQERGTAHLTIGCCRCTRGPRVAIRKGFPWANWQQYKVHFMQNILTLISYKDKESFAKHLNTIWLVTTREQAD